VVNRIDIEVSALGNFSQIQTELTKLKATIAQLQSQPLLGTSGQETAKEIQNVQKRFDQMVLSTRAFNVQMVEMSDSVDKFGQNLERGKLKLHDYFKIYRENARGIRNELDELADRQARIGKSVIIPDALKTGYSRVITSINADLKTLGAQEDAVRIKAQALNTVIRGMGTELVNLGKNTQWAGRQLTVGLTVPLSAFGAAAAKAFRDVDKELTRMAKVYGDGVTQTSEKTISEIRSQTLALANELAATYGMAAQQTAAVAADLAATGLQGNDLLKATKETMRLSTLGELDQQSAIKATVALQRTFRLSTKDLTESINYLNAVENQTSTSLGDLVEGLPRAAVVVKQLGGSYKDLSAMMVAMREAGVPAAEAANSIKSAMASIINPSTKATESLKSFGIDIQDITTKNAGNLIGMIRDLQSALDSIGGTNKVRMIEEIFGKFQFAKVTALLDNLGKAGSQTQRAFQLAASSSSQLATLAESELKRQTESVSGRYNRAIQDFKTKIVPLGEQVTKWATTAMNVFNKFLDILNKFAPLKNLFVGLFGGLAIVGPVLMMTGIMANLVGSIIKGANAFRMFKDGFKTGGLREAFSSIQNFYQNIDISAMAAAQNTQQFGSNALNAVKAFEVLNLELVKLKERLHDLALHPITLNLKTNYASLSDEELYAMNLYEKDSKQQGGERPHYTSKSDAMRMYQSNPSSYRHLQEIEKDYISQHGPQEGARKFKQYFEEGQSAQYGMVQQGGAAALLQQRYGKENVIYGPKSGVTKEEIYTREVARLVDIHDQILTGKIKDQELAAEQLTRILGTESKKDQTLNAAELSKLESIVAQVTFAEEQMEKAVIDNLVQQKAVLSGSAESIEELNIEIKRIMTTGDPKSRAARVGAAWSNFLNTLSQEAIDEITTLRNTLSTYAGASTPQQTLMMARNVEARIARQALEAGDIRAAQLGPGETMGAQRIRSALVAYTPSFPQKLQTGGSPWVPGSGDGDKIPALLEPGEFVVNKNAAKQYGGLLNDINFNKAPRFQTGDKVETSNAYSAEELSQILGRTRKTPGKIHPATGAFGASIEGMSVERINALMLGAGIDPKDYLESIRKGAIALDKQDRLYHTAGHVFLDGLNPPNKSDLIRKLDESITRKISAMGGMLNDTNNPLHRITDSVFFGSGDSRLLSHWRQFSVQSSRIDSIGRRSPSNQRIKTFGDDGEMIKYDKLVGKAPKGGEKTTFFHSANEDWSRSIGSKILRRQLGGGVPGFVSGGSTLEDIWGDNQRIYRAPQWQGPRLPVDYGFKTRLPVDAKHPFFSTEEQAEAYRQEYLSTPRGGSEKLDLRDIYRFDNDEYNLQALANTWQQGPKGIRNYPDKLEALLRFFTPIKQAMTLRRKSMLGIPGEMPDAQQIAILKALESGNYESILGSKFSLAGKPSAYTEWGPSWLMSREFHEHPLKMRQAENMVSNAQSEIENLERFVANLQSPDKETSKFAREQLVKINSLFKSAEDITPENIEKLRQSKQRMLEMQIESQKALSPMGIKPRDVIFQRLFGAGTPMLDISAANPNAKYRGTKLMEREWLANPGEPTLDSISQAWIPPNQYLGGKHLYPEWVKNLPYVLNMKQRGGIQHLAFGGSALERMAYKPINMISQIRNYLRMVKLLKRGVYHGSYSGIEELPVGGGKLLFDNEGGEDVAFGGMQLFGTTDYKEASSYATNQFTESDTENSAVYRLLGVPFGKYINYASVNDEKIDSSPRNIKALKRQNYDLWKYMTAPEQQGRTKSTQDNTADAFSKLGIKGFFSTTPAVGSRLNEEQKRNMWTVFTSPKGISLADSPNKGPELSIFDLLKSLMSQRSGNKELREWFESKGHKFQTGGSPWVPGSGNGDRVPAMLEPGEFVVNKKAAKQYDGLLNHLNWNAAPRFATGSGEPGKETLFGSIVNKLFGPLTTGMQMAAGAERSKANRGQTRETDPTKIVAQITVSAKTFKDGVDSITTPIDAMRRQVVKAEVGLQDLATSIRAATGATAQSAKEAIKERKQKVKDLIPTRDTSLQGQVRKLSKEDQRKFVLGAPNPIEPYGQDQRGLVPRYEKPPRKFDALGEKVKASFKQGPGIGSMIGAQFGGMAISGLASKMQPGMAQSGVTGAATGLQMGAMLGPYGMLAGAAIGGIFGVVSNKIAEAKQKAKVASDGLRDAISPSSVALNNLGIKVRSFSDAVIKAGRESDKAATNIERIANSYKSSGDEQTTNALKYIGDLLKEGKTGQIGTLSTKRYATQILQGVSPGKAREDLLGYLQAAGVGSYTASNIVSKATKNIDPENALGKVFGKILPKERAPLPRGPRAPALPPGFVEKTLDKNDYKSIGTALSTQALTANPRILGQAIQNLDALQKTAANNKNSFEEFNRVVKESDPSLAKLNLSMKNAGAAGSSIVRVNALMVNGMQMTAEEAKALSLDIVALAAAERKLSQEMSVSTATQSMMTKATAKDAQSGTLAKTATEIAIDSKQKQIEAIQDYINQQQKLINQIDKEKSARDKAFQSSQQQINNERTLADLQAGITRAGATGDLISMAKAQSDYNAEIAKQAEQKKKDAADAVDDKRIAVIQKRIEKSNNQIDDLNKQMSKLQKVAANAITPVVKESTKAQDAVEGIQKRMKTLLNSKSYTEKEEFYDLIKGDKGIQGYMKIAGTSADDLSKAIGKVWKSDGISNADLNGRLDLAAAKMGEFGDKTEKATRLQRVFNMLLADPKLKIQQAVDKEALEWEKAHPKPTALAKARGVATATRAGTGVATGGYITGPGTATSDSIPAMLSNGEYVVQASSVGKYGVAMLNSINNGTFGPRYATGGIVKNYSIGDRGSNSSLSSNAVYNITVSVDTNANPDEIANKIMRTIQREQKSMSTGRSMGGF